MSPGYFYYLRGPAESRKAGPLETSWVFGPEPGMRRQSRRSLDGYSVTRAPENLIGPEQKESQVGAVKRLCEKTTVKRLCEKTTKR
jgi:hypothetical protein